MPAQRTAWDNCIGEIKRAVAYLDVLTPPSPAAPSRTGSSIFVAPRQTRTLLRISFCFLIPLERKGKKRVPLSLCPFPLGFCSSHLAFRILWGRKGWGRWTHPGPGRGQGLGTVGRRADTYQKFTLSPNELAPPPNLSRIKGDSHLSVCASLDPSRCLAGIAKCKRKQKFEGSNRPAVFIPAWASVGQSSFFRHYMEGNCLTYCYMESY